LEVKTGADAIKTVKYWNYQTSTYGADPGNVPGTSTPFGAAFKRFCSAFLASPPQLFNPATGRGFDGRLPLRGPLGQGRERDGAIGPLQK